VLTKFTGEKATFAAADNYFGKLRRNGAADRVGREIGERTQRPVDVLQHAFDIAGRADAEARFHARIPGLGEIAHGEAVHAERPLTRGFAGGDVVECGAVDDDIGAIVGDFLAGSAQGGVGGIGYMTITYFSQLKTPALFATGLVACLMGFVFVGGVNWLHWRLLHLWHDSMVKKE
jgi:hypothetical protein